MICGRPQSNNEVNNFGDVVIEAVRSAALKIEGASLPNASVDRTSCESHWCRKMAIDYLKGKSN